MKGVAGDGERIVCEDDKSPRITTMLLVRRPGDRIRVASDWWSPETRGRGPVAGTFQGMAMGHQRRLTS
jgi:hypothetical protein